MLEDKKLKAYCMSHEDGYCSYIVFEYDEDAAKEWVRQEFSESYDEGEEFEITATEQPDFLKHKSKDEPHFLDSSKDTSKTFRDNMWNSGHDLPICSSCDKGVFNSLPESKLCEDCEKCQECCNECWEDCNYCGEKEDDCNCEEDNE